MTVAAILRMLGGLSLAGVIVLIVAASVVAGLSVGIVGGLWERLHA